MVGMINRLDIRWIGSEVRQGIEEYDRRHDDDLDCRVCHGTGFCEGRKRGTASCEEQQGWAYQLR